MTKKIVGVIGSGLGKGICLGSFLTENELKEKAIKNLVVKPITADTAKNTTPFENLRKKK